MNVSGAVVSVLIPARNEARHIAACIAAIAAQDFPLDRLEVVVVDGSSQDGTAEAAARALAGHGFSRTEVIANPEGTTPSNLNAGLAAARGTYVCRVDARSLVPPDYVRRCIDVLASRPEVVVVGGSQRAVSPRRGAVGVGIARALNNRWAMGFSRYRRGAPSGPSDTVYLGAFRTGDLRVAGGWNLDFETNQDFELNRRLSRHGRIWYESGLDVGYVPRGSLRDLFQQYARFGHWKVRYWRQTGDGPVPRQMALLAVPPLVAFLGVFNLTWSSPLGRLKLLSTGLVGVTVIELAGSDGPASGPLGHAVGVAAMATTSAGWLLGVYCTLLGRTPGPPAGLGAGKRRR